MIQRNNVRQIRFSDYELRMIREIFSGERGVYGGSVKTCYGVVVRYCIRQVHHTMKRRRKGR